MSQLIVTLPLNIIYVDSYDGEVIKSYENIEQKIQITEIFLGI